MKRRVQQNKDAKKVLRWHQTALHLKAPYKVVLDSSFVRAAAKGRCPELVSLLQAPFDGHISLVAHQSSVRVLRETDLTAAQLLAAASPEYECPDEVDKNEHKSITKLVSQQQSHVFVATVAHDLRKALAVLPNASVITFTSPPPAARMHYPCRGEATEPSARTDSVVSTKDRAFMAAKRAPNAVGGSNLTPRRRVPSENSGPNPLSRKPKRVREAFVAEDLDE